MALQKGDGVVGDATNGKTLGSACTVSVLIMYLPLSCLCVTCTFSEVEFFLVLLLPSVLPLNVAKSSDPSIP